MSDTNVKYVKLIAKPNTWFKSGSEVFNCDGKRLTLELYNEWLKSGNILVKGIPSGLYNEPELGDQLEDEELCEINEFIMEIVNDPTVNLI